MVIKIDLRIPEKTIRRTEAETGFTHYLVFAAAAAFVLTVVAVLLAGAWKVHTLRCDIAEITAKVNSIKGRLSATDVEHSRLSGEAAEFGTRLNYMLDDIPSIEVLTILDTILPEDMVIESLTISGGKATFKGVALKEDDVLQLVGELSASRFAASVGVPEITALQVHDAYVRAFTVSCTLKPLHYILADVAPEKAVIIETSPDVAGGDADEGDVE